MKKAAICVSVLAIQLMACANNKKNTTVATQAADTPKTQQSTKQAIHSVKQPVIKLDTTGFYEPYFKYHNLVKFNMDKYDWESRRDHYRQLDSVAFFAINQDTEFKEFPGIEGSYDLDFFYSLQKNSTRPGLIEFTILSQREDSYCESILYRIFNKQKKLISTFIVASSCGDGGDYSSAHGRFENDSTYVLLSVDNYESSTAKKGDVINYTKTTTLIKADGSIVQKGATLKTVHEH